jgi:RND superfamily putative drug exporter
VTALAHYAFVWRKRILLCALAVGLVAAYGASSLFDAVKPYGFQDPASESSEAYELLEGATGERPLPDVVLVVDPGTVPTAGSGARRVEEVAEKVAAVPDVTTVETPREDPGLVSNDGQVALVLGTLSADVDDVADVGETVEERFADEPDVTAGGAAVTANQLNTTTEDDLRRIELFAAPILFLLLLFVFRGLVAAALPLAVGALSIASTLGLLRALAEVMDIDLFVINIVTALGLGLAIDYSLFIVSRYRDEIAERGATGDALRETMRTAGRMAIYSGITVAAVLAPLCVFPQRFLYSIGVGGALVALCSALVCVVFLPAALALLGERVNALAPGWLRPKRRTSESWSTVGRMVMDHPILVVLTVGTILVAAGLPMLRLEITRADATVLPEDSSAREVDEIIGQDFRSDPSSRMTIVIRDPDSVKRVDKAAGRAAGHPALGTSTVEPAGDGGLQRRDINVTAHPFSDDAVEGVEYVRDLDWGGEALVGGPTAELVDQRDSLREHLPLAIAIIVAATALVLFAMTGSLILPLVTLLTNVLTVLAAFGILVLVFQDGRFEDALGYTSQSALDSSVPILLFALIFGLSTDYGVFLLQRIAEERRSGASNETAISVGVLRTRRLITAAALLFAVAMGAFAWSDLIFIKEVAIGTALAVLIDATVMRALLLPAILRLLGPAAWWGPGRTLA